MNAGRLIDGAFSFVNEVPDDYSPWHRGALDHSPDTGTDGSKGYMMLVGADHEPGEIFRLTMNDLCIGARYELSVYAANILKKGSNLIKANILFEVRTATSDNTLIATVTSGEMNEYDTLTWTQYGMSFYTPTTSIVLLMISNAPGGGGNDFVVDDIVLRTCGTSAVATCSPRESCICFAYDSIHY